MPKITIEAVAEALSSAKVDVAIQRQIIESLNASAEAAKEDRVSETLPKGKRQYVLVVSDPTGQIAALKVPLVGWPIQIEEGRPAGAILEDIRLAAGQYNGVSRKGKQTPVRTVGEAIEVVPRRYWKAPDGTKVIPKGKTPVEIVITDNRL